MLVSENRRGPMEALPIATVLSNREFHNNVPGISSSWLMPLLELGRDIGVLDVENNIIRTEGMLKRTSIESALGGGCWGVEAERPANGDGGSEEAIGNIWPS
jgi:hypothetical protein